MRLNYSKARFVIAFPFQNKKRSLKDIFKGFIFSAAFRGGSRMTI